MADVSRIVIDPNIRFGKPTIRGTRITVEEVVRAVSEGMSPETIVEEWKAAEGRRDRRKTRQPEGTG